MKILQGLGFMITTWLMYLLLPLLGWGLGDVGGFVSAPPRAVYAALMILMGLLIGYQAIERPEGVRGGPGQAGKRLSRQHVVRILAVLLLFVALTFLPYADRRGIGVMVDRAAIRWIGLGLYTFGIVLIVWSGFTLGRLYSAEVTLQEDHQLITGGLYRTIRHPRYLGAELVGLGLSLLFRSWIGLVLGGAFIFVLLFRIRDEEAFMHQAFGEAWEAYCQRSWRLIPYLY